MKLRLTNTTLFLSRKRNAEKETGDSASEESVPKRGATRDPSSEESVPKRRATRSRAVSSDESSVPKRRATRSRAVSSDESSVPKRRATRTRAASSEEENRRQPRNGNRIGQKKYCWLKMSRFAQ